MFLSKRGCCCGDSFACDPCPIPRADLTLSQLAGGGTTVGTLTWNGTSAFWQLDVGGAGLVVYTLFCDQFGTSMELVTFDSSETMTLVDFTCDPLHIVFHSILLGPNDYYVDYP